MKKNLLFLLLFVSWLTLGAQPKREMRAAWIATVKNIDWPSDTALLTIDQQREIVAMLDKFQQLKMNAVFVQVRPCADSFYKSDLEPWSMYLTGKQGKSPEYDPLQFIIDEAHKRCIEVHAWMNPYRVAMTADTTELHPEHLFFRQRNLFVEYGGKLYFDPAYDETRAFLCRVVADVVARYDIDAIHFDDYFYPYRVAGKDFPDARSFATNPRGFAPNEKDDWRRDNVNRVIAELQRTIKSAKPWVDFGISPFGVWRNADKDPLGSATKAGMTNYDDLYADILKWLRDGDIDYVVPQLYWEIGKRNADYAVLIDWWNRNTFGKNLYIGLFASGLGVTRNAAWQSGNELVRQMRMNADYDKVKGVAFYSAAPFLRNPLGLLDSLSTTFYRNWALPPMTLEKSACSEAVAPADVRLQARGGDLRLTWRAANDATNGTATVYYVVYAFKDKNVPNTSKAENICCITSDTTVNLMNVKGLRGEYTFGVTAVNRYRAESRLVLLKNKSIYF